MGEGVLGGVGIVDDQHRRGNLRRFCIQAAELDERLLQKRHRGGDAVCALIL